MQPNEITDQLKSKLDVTRDHFKEELAKVRTGRANAAILDKVMVMAYGVSMPIKQVANVTAPEAQLIQITPFDPSNIQPIASAIREDQNLGLNPVDDGAVVRITVPPLTTERRQEIVKQIHAMSEDTLVSMRNSRHEVLKEAETAKKDRKITEDDYRSIDKEVEELMSTYKTEIDSLIKNKEQEVMTV
jgi:ribosome recycling factor